MTVLDKSILDLSTVNSILLSNSIFKPVAVTTKSAGNSSPDFNFIPLSVKCSILSVTTEAFLLLIESNKSPLGTKHIL